MIKLFIAVFIFFIPLHSFSVSAQTKYVCDKTLNDKWRDAADSGKYNEAINMLLDSVARNTNKNKSTDYWHIGQLYACNNDYVNAIKYLRKSASFFSTLADHEWQLYYKGTIAFLKRDKTLLEKCCQRLWLTHSAYYEKNACTLKVLSENFELPYKVASMKVCNPVL